MAEIEKLNEVKHLLGVALLKLNAILDDPNTTKDFTYISGLTFAKEKIDKALEQIAWFETTN